MVATNKNDLWFFQITLHKFDRLCLLPVEPLAPEQIKKIREQARMS